MAGPWIWIQVTVVLFLATLIRSALGFGEALIAVPLLAFLMPVEVAAPTAVLVSITVALVIVIQDWRNVHARSAAWLIVSTMLGIPLGLFSLKSLPGPVIQAILGAVVAAFSLHSLARRSTHELKDDRLAGWFGFTAGILGGAYGMNGPPLAIYGSLRRWSPQHFRATLQAYFLPASLVGLAAYAALGLWTSTITRFYLISLPGVLVAIVLGRVINHRLRGELFLKFIHVGLILLGVLLLVQSRTK